jgi:putative inorganic carbon (hco3(-)) transporter
MVERLLPSNALSPLSLSLGALLAAISAYAAITPGGWEKMALVLVLVGGLGLLIGLIALGPAYTVSAAIACTVLSGHWKTAGFPIPLDRGAMVLALATVLVRPDMRRECFRRATQPIGLVLCALVVYGIVSAEHAGTLSNSSAAFGLLDNLGIVPAVMFIIGPVVYRTARERDVLLMTLVLIGAYLGLTALFETTGPKSLVFPRYISNPAIGIHFGRARGPFVEAVANGLALYVCGVAAAIAWHRWRPSGKGNLAAAAVVLCGMGTIFTLTRSIWIAAAVGTLVTMAAFRPLRRFLLPALGIGAVTAVAVLFLIPGFSSKATERESSQVPVWDRLNTDAAAIRVTEQNPLFGTGWWTFEGEGVNYLRQSESYPLTGAHLPVHNVFLARLAELGVVGTALWVIAFGMIIFQGAIRAGPPEMLPWRMGFVAVVVSWLIVALFAPLTYPLSNLLLWLWAGLLVPLPVERTLAVPKVGPPLVPPRPNQVSGPRRRDPVGV